MGLGFAVVIDFLEFFHLLMISFILLINWLSDRLIGGWFG